MHGPGLMLGDLLFSRSGVRIVAGSRHALKSVAEQSPLYFAYRRLHRRTVDLSQGWGSNSQWRTLVRRNYVAGDRLIYNIDGTTSLDATGPTHRDEAGLTAAQRLELCRHRCFVVTDNNDPDLIMAICRSVRRTLRRDLTSAMIDDGGSHLPRRAYPVRLSGLAALGSGHDLLAIQGLEHAAVGSEEFQLRSFGNKCGDQFARPVRTAIVIPFADEHRFGQQAVRV